ncbi:MAG TPA: DMT family transporter [Trinickia sp.]|jgi:drug/metabolite transporter (DMT)-like permease|uniref:DMT family transporter n=1 Tax=Trinickia sp. TaxID=2571163 RepID=UPI002C980389|nr:DMT family transporter [Trinickia sp.]HTI17509.1 DMT family transporter [Trinickia sp.]
MNSRESQGMMLGLVGVLIFSLTLPMTRIVVHEFSPVLSGLGRALVAAVPAGALLAWRRERRPTLVQLKGLAVVALGVIIAFPVLSAWAMKTVPSSHGAIVMGLQPLFVAVYAAWLAHERPSAGFWASAVLGSALVVAYAIDAGGGTPAPGDALMLLSVAIGALGYAEGARLARQMGGWQVICWTLVIAAPFILLPVVWLAWQAHLHHPGPVAFKTWLAFGYISLFSQLIGFFAWYAGLARGGIARVGQVQLLQIFFTMALAALFFGESVNSSTWLFAAAVIATVLVGRKAGVRTAVPTPATVRPER